MGDPNKGTDNLCENAGWYIIDEAECIDSFNELEELFENSTSSTISNLIDDVDVVDEGLPLDLFNQQVTEECTSAIENLKRKFIGSPESVADLSPRLQAVQITPRKGSSSKRKLFDDSGIVEDETADHAETQVATESAEPAGENGAALNLDVLNASHKQAIVMSKFKEEMGVAFSELTRQFKSDKTCCENWVMCVYRAAEEVTESSKVVLEQYCNYHQVHVIGVIALYLVSFKVSKSRETIKKLMATMLNVNEWQITCEPPKIRSPAAALFFYQKNVSGVSFSKGECPEWILRHTMVGHCLASAAEAFDLSGMVQWAWDNDFTEEPEIAYNYASIADVDSNAAAFLKSNQQYKYVRDCANMVKLYKRQAMKTMTMSQWIQKCCSECQGEGNWKDIAGFLRFQGVNVITFLIHLKTWLKNTPKKNCMLIYGPSDTGKSYFCFSLLSFLRGKVVSYMNSRSHFWLQPLQDGKVGFIDDATYPCWQYIDVHMRTALDGNVMSIDAKHKAPAQIRLPPMLISSNVDIFKEPTLLHVQTRIIGIEFPNKMPLNADGSPVYTINNCTWKSFFTKLARQLEITFEEEGDESERFDRAFRCTAGAAAESN